MGLKDCKIVSLNHGFLMDYTDDTDCVLCMELTAEARTCLSADRDVEVWWVVLRWRRWSV
jgi:hypothetical protein